MVLTVLLIIIYVAFISLGLPDSLLGSAWPAMHVDIGVPISYAGIVSMIIAGGTIISSFFSDKIIRKLGTGIVTAISVSMTAIALLGFSISNEFIYLCLWAIPLGLGAGSIDAALNNFVALHYKAKHMSWLHCFWGVGAMTGPIIMSYCLEKGAFFQLGYRVVAIIQFILVAILVITLPLWKKIKLSSKIENQEKLSENVQEHKVLSVKELLQLPGAKQVLIAFFCYCAIEATTGLWGSSFMVTQRGISAETAARWTSLFYFGITFGRFLSGFVTMKLNHKQMIRLGEIIILLGVIALLLPFGNLVLCAGFILIGLGCAPIYPSLLHETPVNFGAEYSQSIMGIQMSCAYIGSTFMPPFFGLLASKISYAIMPYFTGGLLILMIVMIELLNKRIAHKNIA
ncbi:MAG: major facilitator superfamily 1 [Anaerocolumna sp.]|jgi:fucose permease|nr:major facilitator superfamily 1 [Anaerocolumna sp.]